ncbi:outer membrane protein assembly factor BamA [Burkholderia ubonensis]|uniref:outer membrane protein assembly factor BamA n=1 Tax=Burkholderia ubonensis TaxID=101571 RepID=UPI00075FF711|nr:outer membrane protein assembly factor BamA [Burkholderia ubonensis]KWO78542.1 outer membrane protein assembly factor BamA [Burkholderia ubonensis]
MSNQALKRFATLGVLLCGGIASGYAHSAQSATIRDIRVNGLKRIEARTVDSYLPVRIGDTFTEEQGTALIRALYATGFFSDVKVSMGDGVLVIDVVERPTIAEVDFDGTREFDKGNLTKAMKSVGLASGMPYDHVLLQRAEQELKRQYLTRGYYAAEVKTTVTPLDAYRVSLLFSVAEGPSAKIRQINFIGNKVFSTSTLLGEMQLSTPTWSSWYTKDNLYSKEKLTGDLENVRAYYLNRGYLEFTIDSTQVSISPDRKDMYLTLSVHEGEPYTVSDIRLSGDLLGRDAELRRLMIVKAGDSFSAEKLQQTTKAIVDKLGEYGYAFAKVNAQPDIDQAAHRVALTLAVDPGKRVYVRHVNIVGNSRTRDEVIRREMRQFEDAWFDSNRIGLSKERISRLGYFTDVDMSTAPVEGAADQVDLQVRVAEKPTGSLTLGGGLSSSDKVVLTAGVTQDNVFGSGTNLGVTVNTAKSSRTLTVTQTDPYFTIDGIQRITSVYYRTTFPLYYSSSSDTSFRIITAGANVKFGIPFSETDMVYFGMGIEQHRLRTDSSTPQSYIDYVSSFGSVSNTVPISVSWARDARDSALTPSRGYYMQASSEYGMPVAKTQYYKADVNAQYYYSFARGYVLGFNFQGGYGAGIGGKPYPIFENYYAGGIGSVRGYEASSLGPRDTKTGDSIGGSKLVVGNIELSIPLPGSGYDRTLRVFTFVDGGNVWGNEGSSTGANGLRYSYGAGLSWISPIGPLKLSLGFPIGRHVDDKYQKFQFQIGTSF